MGALVKVLSRFADMHITLAIFFYEGLVVMWKFQLRKLSQKKKTPFNTLFEFKQILPLFHCY